MSELSDELREFAGEVGELPATGMIDAAQVSNLLGQAIRIIDATKKAALDKELLSLDRIEYAQDQAERVLDQNIRLAAQNAALIKNNRMLSFIAAGAVVVALVGEIYLRIIT